jgi:hypothetical protein
MSEPLWPDWLLDVTMDPPCFVPYERGRAVLGMCVLTDRCPGRLVGVIHEDGQAAAENWCAENPDWRERYRKDGGT